MSRTNSTVARRLAAILLFAAAGRLTALDVPPKPTQWVNDYGANLLTPAQTRQLNDRIEQLYKRTGARFLVMIWPSLEGDDARELTDRVAGMWKVEDDRALMLFVFVHDRKTFIKVGHGLDPVITDAYASDVYRNALVPFFRQGRFYAGIYTAIDLLAAKIEPGSAPPVPLSRPSTRVRPPLPVDTANAVPCADVVVGGLVLIAVLALIAVIIVAITRRPGGGAGSLPTPGVGRGQTMFYDAYGNVPGVTHTSAGVMSSPAVGSQDVGSYSVGGSWGGGGDSSFNGDGAGGSW